MSLCRRKTNSEYWCVLYGYCKMQYKTVLIVSHLNKYTEKITYVIKRATFTAHCILRTITHLHIQLQIEYKRSGIIEKCNITYIAIQKQSTTPLLHTCYQLFGVKINNGIYLLQTHEAKGTDLPLFPVVVKQCHLYPLTAFFMHSQVLMFSRYSQTCM